jgi:glycosyltransferase involved in cell wall biosynthesis
VTRVLVVESAGNLWGSERSLIDFVEGVHGLQLAVCCPAGTPLIPELKKLKVAVLPYFTANLHEKSRLQRIGAAAAVIRACREFRPDVIHLNQAGSYKVVLPAAKLFKLPIVAHIRIFEDIEYLAHQKPNAERLRGLIAISKAIETEIGEFESLRNIPVHQLYNAYVSRRSHDLPEPFRDYHNRVACVGRLVPMKGQDVLVKALPRLTERVPALNVLMVGEGDGAYVESLKEIVRLDETESRLSWLGFVKETVPLEQTCSVLACPSHREPLGRVVLEAWDAGAVPVVFAGSGGAAEIVAASCGGITYEPQTPDALANAILQALRLPVLERKRMIAAGRAWLATNTDPLEYGQRLARIFVRAAKASQAKLPGKTRALVVEPSADLWGSERALLDLLGSMTETDIAVCCPPERPMNAELTNLGIRRLPYFVYSTHTKSRLLRLRAAVGVIRACLAFRPNVIYVNQAGAYKVSLLAARVFRIPMVVHVRLFEDAAYLARNKPSPERLRAIIAISDSVLEELRTFDALAAIAIHRLYDSYFVPASVDYDAAGERQRNRIVCAGRMEGRKAQDVLIQAIAVMSRSGFDGDCFLLGSGSELVTASLKTTAENSGVANIVHFAGFRSDVLSQLALSSVMACPSHREPLGRVIFDAWTAGAIPVVFAGSGGAAELVLKAGAGIMYAPQDPESLADALFRGLRMTSSERASMIASGRRWMTENADPKAYAAAMEKILMNACRPGLPA